MKASKLIARALIGAALLILPALPAAATTIERVASPLGIEVWLVKKHRTEGRFAVSPTPLFHVQYLFLAPQ